MVIYQGMTCAVHLAVGSEIYNNLEVSRLVSVWSLFRDCLIVALIHE